MIAHWIGSYQLIDHYMRTNRTRFFIIHGSYCHAMREHRYWYLSTAFEISISHVMLEGQHYTCTVAIFGWRNDAVWIHRNDAHSSRRIRRWSLVVHDGLSSSIILAVVSIFLSLTSQRDGVTGLWLSYLSPLVDRWASKDSSDRRPSVPPSVGGPRGYDATTTN